MMVGPTNFRPRFLSSLEMASASGETPGGPPRRTTGRPSTKDQSQRAKLPCSAAIARKARALGMTEASLPRWRMSPGSRIQTSTFAGANRATLRGSKPAKTWR